MANQRVVYKSLAGQDDLLFGEGQEVQTRAGGTYNIEKNRVIYPVNSLAELAVLDPEQFPKARLYSGDSVTEYLFNSTTEAYEPTGLDIPFSFDTEAEFKTAAIEFKDGQTVYLKDRGASFTKVTGTGGGNDANIIASTSVNQSISLIVKDEIQGRQWGLIGGLDESAIVQLMVDYLTTERLPIQLPALANLQFTNILLPSSGVILKGKGVTSTVITNSSLVTPIFNTGTARNLWIELDEFKTITPDGGCTAIHIRSFEHLDLGNVECTTAPAERGAGTSSGVIIERGAVPESGYYLNISKAVKVDRHGYGVRIRGVSGANCNANLVRGLVTNDNTNAGVRLDFCTGLKLKDGSAEINKNNIEIFDSVGCTVNGYYMERPETHNVQIIRGDLCQVIGNPIISSAGAGVGYSGASPDFAGRAVYIQESVGVTVSDNGFIDPWATAADVEITADSSACAVIDNRKRNRIGGFTSYTVEVLDNAGDTINRNFQKTGGGTVRMYDQSSAPQVGNNITTELGRELKIGQPDDVKLYSGTGTPEGVVLASRGSVFLRTNGGGGFTFYVKETGDATNTGWVAK